MAAGESNKKERTSSAAATKVKELNEWLPVTAFGKSFRWVCEFSGFAKWVLLFDVL